MKSFKRGRGPSMMGGVVAICMAVFGLIWTVMASRITKDPFGDMGGMMGGFGDFGTSSTSSGIGSIFPLFGVVFMVIAIAMAIYNFKNATSKNRYSEFDIVDGHEEPDPLNQRYGETHYQAGAEGGHDDATRFCPYCGGKMEASHVYCPHCGRAAASRR